jgi:hypothetical protein
MILSIALCSSCNKSFDSVELFAPGKQSFNEASPKVSIRLNRVLLELVSVNIHIRLLALV